jgi:hypothetical protein
VADAGRDARRDGIERSRIAFLVARDGEATAVAMLNLDEKLDEALRGTFPASDAFYLAPDAARTGDLETPAPAAASNDGSRKE